MSKLNPTTTSIYIHTKDKFLLIYRNKEENDFNKGLYLGIGGHKEKDETIEECLIREVKEESNLDLLSYTFHGIIEFKDNEYEEIMYLYSSDNFKGDIKECDEGELVWVDKIDLFNLPMYEGDKYFINDILNNKTNIHYKFIYDNRKLIEVIDLKGE